MVYKIKVAKNMFEFEIKYQQTLAPLYNIINIIIIMFYKKIFSKLSYCLDQLIYVSGQFGTEGKFTYIISQ